MGAQLSENRSTMGDEDSTRATLLLRLRDRTDSLSWHEFHDRYGELLYRYARRRGASAIDAEDIVQEVEVALLSALDGFEYDARKGRFRSYLRVAVVRAMARRSAKDQREAPVFDPHTFDYLSAAQEAEQDERWEREWRLHRLRWALRTGVERVRGDNSGGIQVTRSWRPFGRGDHIEAGY